MRFSNPFTRSLAAATFSLAILFCATAGWCEFQIDVTENSGITGNFFQTSGYLDGTDFHLAFIQSVDGNPPYKVYYVPIDASADFSSTALTGDTLRLKDITLVDLGVPAYIDGKTPWIFPITDNNVEKSGIVFIGDSTLFFALINPNLDNDSLQPTVDVLQSIPVTPSSNVTSLSATSDTSGNLHLAYTDSGNIYYAQTPFDDFSSPVDNILLDSSSVPPQIVIDADLSENAHIVWAADDGTGKQISYYAMTDPDSATVPSKVLIPKTRIFGQEANTFTAPWISVISTSSIFLSAIKGDDPQVPGIIYLANINPGLAPQNGSALVDPDEIFTAEPAPLGIEFSNPVILSDIENRIHISGTGAGGTGLTFASAQFSSTQFVILENQKPVSLVDLPEPLDMFDRSALAYFSSGKAVIAWSGTGSGASENHIFSISTVAPAFPPQPQNESGCAINGKSPGVRTGIWSLLLIFAPPILFVLSSRIRRKAANRRGM